jgi:hypothetical protein
MSKRLGAVLLVMAFLGAFSGMGCSGKKEDAPIPDMPKGGLKNITPSTVSPRQLLPTKP